MSTFDLSRLLASFLLPRDAVHLSMTSSRILASASAGNGGSDEETTPGPTPAAFVNISLRSSLLSVIRQRSGFYCLAEPLLEGLRFAARLYGTDQLVIAGSTIIQAVTNGGMASDGSTFSASDIDFYTTTTALPYARSYLTDLGFTLTRVSTSDYTFMDHHIHHVESYSLIPAHMDIIKMTVGDAVRWNLIRQDFVVAHGNPYAIPENFPFSPEHHRLGKEIDLVVTSSTTVNETLRKFDIEPCMGHFNGIGFCIPNLYRILQNEARLRCPNWAALLSAYLNEYLSLFRLSDLEQISLARPLPSEVIFAKHCFVAILRKGIHLPNRDGVFEPTRTELGARYCIILHNMLTKITLRIIKYAGRGFTFPDVTVPQVSPNSNWKQNEVWKLPPRPAHEEDSGPIGQISNKRRPPVGTSTSSGVARRVKLLHRDDIPSPARRAKLRFLDRDGFSTSSFCSLEDSP